jgi:hypothetical protein
MICGRSIGPLTFDPKIRMNKLLATQTTTTSSIRFSSLRRRITRNCRWQSNEMPRRQNESGLLQRLKNEPPLTGLCLRFPRAVRSLWEAANYKCDCTGAVFRHEFETRRFPSLAATRRDFTFYVADPLSSIHPPPHMRYDAVGAIYTNDQTSCLMVRDSWFPPGM